MCSTDISPGPFGQKLVFVMFNEHASVIPKYYTFHVHFFHYVFKKEKKNQLIGFLLCYTNKALFVYLKQGILIGRFSEARWLRKAKGDTWHPSGSGTDPPSVFFNPWFANSSSCLFLGSHPALTSNSARSDDANDVTPACVLFPRKKRGTNKKCYKWVTLFTSKKLSPYADPSTQLVTRCQHV